MNGEMRGRGREGEREGKRERERGGGERGGKRDERERRVGDVYSPSLSPNVCSCGLFCGPYTSTDSVHSSQRSREVSTIQVLQNAPLKGGGEGWAGGGVS